MRLENIRVGMKVRVDRDDWPRDMRRGRVVAVEGSKAVLVMFPELIEAVRFAPDELESAEVEHA